MKASRCATTEHHPASAARGILPIRTLPKALPDGSRDTHTRLRYDRIGTTGVVTLLLDGRLHPICIGRTHARIPVILLITNLHVRIINAITGEILRELTLDPTRDYQSQTKPNMTKPLNP